MVSEYNQAIVRRALAHLGIPMRELMHRATAEEAPGRNSLETERKAKQGLEQFKNGLYPDHLIQFCERIMLQAAAGIPNAEVRNLAARRAKSDKVTDLNTRRQRKPK